MGNRYQLFTVVDQFYASLLSAVSLAEKSISMMYLIYDHGTWAERLNRVLIEKHLSGVKVRIMADYLGTLLDHPLNITRNLRMFNHLKDMGLDVTFFRPAGQAVTALDRLHIKMCAIDEGTVFIGGSNIGDYYTNWRDTNLKIEGDLGPAGHDLFDFVRSKSIAGNGYRDRELKLIDFSDCWFGDAKVQITVPGAVRGIYQCLLNTILTTTSTLYLRYWYFLPNKEFLDAMLSKLDQGVGLRIMLSNSTRIPVIDLVNRIALRKLVRAGAEIYRFDQSYMHSKIMWTERGEIVIGSANMEFRGMNNNFELCANIKDLRLAAELTANFKADTKACFRLSPR